MALFADLVSFGKPGPDFVIDLIDAFETKGVEMIARRKRFDPTKARVLEAPSKNDVAVHPVPPDDESGEAHPDMKRDSGLFGQDGDRPVLFRDRPKLVEDRANRR